MYSQANSTFRSDAKPPTPGCSCKTASPPRARRASCPGSVTQRQSRRPSGARRASFAPRAMNRTYSVETANQTPRPNYRPSVVAVPMPRNSGPPASPIRSPTHARTRASNAPDMNSTAEFIARAVKHRLVKQEREERATMERNLTQMQQFRRELIQCVLRDNKGTVMANQDSPTRPSEYYSYDCSEPSKYATASDRSSYMTASAMSSYMTSPNLSYATAPYLTSTDVPYATASNMSSYVTVPDMSSILDTSSTPANGNSFDKSAVNGGPPCLEFLDYEDLDLSDPPPSLDYGDLDLSDPPPLNFLDYEDLELSDPPPLDYGDLDLNDLPPQAFLDYEDLDISDPPPPGYEDLDLSDPPPLNDEDLDLSDTPPIVFLDFEDLDSDEEPYVNEEPEVFDFDLLLQEMNEEMNGPRCPRRCVGR